MEPQPQKEAANLYAAMFALQAELDVVKKDAVNPHFKSRYADLPSIMEELKPLLQKFGLLVIQEAAPSEAGVLRLKTHIVHVESQERITSELTMPLGGNLGPQPYGSAITYARRYSLGALFQIITDEDDDGNAAQGEAQPRTATQAGPPRKVTEAQIKRLWAISNKSNWPKERVYAVIKKKGYEDVHDLDSTVYDALCQHIEKHPLTEGVANGV